MTLQLRIFLHKHINVRLLLNAHLFNLFNVRLLLRAHLFKRYQVGSLLFADLFQVSDPLICSFELLSQDLDVSLHALCDTTLASALQIECSVVVELHDQLLLLT